MNTKFKLLGSVLALSMLAACGGSDGDDAAVVEDPVVTGPVSAKVQWLAHESAFTGIGISSVAFGLAVASAQFLDAGMPAGAQACATPPEGTAGTVTGVYTDLDSSGTPTKNDTIDFTFANCYSEEVQMAVAGQVKVLLNGFTGDPQDETANSNVAMTFTPGAAGLVLDDETTIKTAGLDFVIDHRAADQFENVTVTTKDADDTDRPLTLDSGTGQVAMVANYVSNFQTSFTTDNNTYSKIEYATTGTSTKLGEFDYAVSTPAAIVAASDGSNISSGVFKSVTAATPAETVTATFTTVAGATSVKMDSSTGTSTTLTFDEFDL